MSSHRPTATQALTALAAGAATTAYYATPDFIASRTARGWAKAGLMTLSVATSIPDLRAAVATRGRTGTTGALRLPGADLPDATGLDATERVARAVDENRTSDEGTPALRDLRPVLVAGVVTAVVAASTVATVAFERWMFRRGEARAAAGRPFAHTRAAVVLGVATTALGLLPTPTDD